ncbi:MAG TPA: SAF domain-containing protein [Bryobacteraceae bacterium]|nr:SAF domain-containing protein [Bryobacteraceae bacterium]
MNFAANLRRRAALGNPVRVGLIGVGKFGSMFLSQALRTPGLLLAGIADLAPARARAAIEQVGGDPSSVPITEDAETLIATDGLELVVDATGDPAAGIRHVRLCCRYGRHIVMVNVEADALAGPLLAREAAQAGIVYSLAYGDQPALIAEQVDWARAAGFEVICAGKGTRYLPAYHASTPETVWPLYGLSAEEAERGGLNPKMFNSFLDGTKSAIEMAAVANATGLTPAPGGLDFPPCSIDDLPRVCRPRASGGELAHAGTVEVVSSLERDGRPVERDLRWGVYVTFEAPSEYVRRCFREYGLRTDESGRYAALYRPYHLIGLELGISVASVALRGEPTGCPTGFRGDVVAVAKRPLAAGEILDGEGGYTVYGHLMRAADSLRLGGLPIGLAHGARLCRPVAAGEPVRWVDVSLDASSEVVACRRAMEALFRSSPGPSA